MKKRIVIILMLFTFAVLPALAQESESSLSYALAFAKDDGEFIATFSEADGWEVQTVPTDLLFGQYDVALVLPKWSEDGQLLGIGYDPTQTFEVEPAYEAPAVYLYRYDIHTQSIEVMSDPIDPTVVDVSAGPIQVLTITSVSPDGRYATLYDLLYSKGYLVDFESKKVVLATDDCGMKAIAWSENSVVVAAHASYIICTPFLIEVDLATGEKIADFSAGLAEQDVTMFESGVQAGENEFVMSAYGNEEYSKTVYIDSSGATIIPGEEKLAENGRGILYTDTFGGLYVNLDSKTAFGVGPDVFLDGDTLHLGESTSDGLVHTVLQPDGTSDSTVLYTGAEPDYYDFAPALDLVAVVSDNKVQIANGEVVWDSAEAGYTDLKADYVSWSDDGLWLHIYGEEISGTYAYNTATGEVIEPPMRDATYVSTSPDGRWWLYRTGEYFATEEPNLLFVYDPLTKEMVTLADDGFVVYNFHFAMADQFVWSPIFE